MGFFYKTYFGVGILFYRTAFNNLTLWRVEYKMICMKKIILSVSLFCFAGVCAASNAYAYIDRDNAVIRIMNKAAGKVQTVTLPVGKMAEFEKLSIMVRTCKQTDPFQAEDFFAFVEINKTDEGKIFSNWLSRNEPGQNPLQNADYDVWLVKCE